MVLAACVNTVFVFLRLICLFVREPQLTTSGGWSSFASPTGEAGSPQSFDQVTALVPWLHHGFSVSFHLFFTHLICSGVTTRCPPHLPAYLGMLYPHPDSLIFTRIIPNAEQALKLVQITSTTFLPELALVPRLG